MTSPSATTTPKSDVDKSTTSVTSPPSVTKQDDASSVCSSEKDADKSIIAVEMSSSSPQEESGYDSDQTLSQNSSPKDSDTNSYDSPTSSPKSSNKLIQPDETVVSNKQVPTVPDQPLKLLSKSEEVTKPLKAAPLVVDEVEEEDLVEVKPKPKTETLFGPEDLIRPKPEESKPVNHVSKVSPVVHVNNVANVDTTSAKHVEEVPDDKVKIKLDERCVEKVSSVNVEPVKPDSDKPAAGSSDTNTRQQPAFKPILESQLSLNEKLVSQKDVEAETGTASDKRDKSLEGKPKIATKPILAPRFFDKPVNPLNLRAVLQNGLGLKPSFKIRPMLSLSR